MPDFAGLEFTGERVVPGLVDPDLLNEHLARYRFAARFAERIADAARVLDAGCGSGYGTAEFHRASSVVGADLSAEAVDHARRNYSRPGVRFLQATCEALPFADGAFDLLVAFEVIEHLAHWQLMLTEARRVMRPAGVLLVSTPKKAYYAESRGEAGPNPYHVREFDYREFETALQDVFPHVRLWTQNHSEAIVFLPAAPAPGDFDAPGDAAPERAHFFLAACSLSPIPTPRAFAWAPASGNILREREHHIVLIESELATKNAWLRQSTDDKASLQRDHENLLAELQRQNEWAGKLNAELEDAGADIVRLQGEIEAAHAGYQERVGQLEQELAATHAGYQERARQVERELAFTHAGYAERVRQLEDEANVRLDWVHDLESQIARGRAEIDRLERESAERAQWGQSLDAELQRANATLARLNEQLHLAARSKWVRLGRLLHLGPVITGREE